ncbi:MAG: tetratricopeptide repeat protein [Gammaproteobacteria bacterium]|nr:tetratricopeptide repeat protein [Gammaproteobacteria bacterium]
MTVLATPLYVYANTKLFDEAKRLIAAMNAKQAYKILIVEQDKLSGNVEYDYLLGLAAVDSGKIDEAIIAFERVLSKEPNNAGAQLDLARAYFNAGSFDLAEGTFLKLRTLNPPASALVAIDKYLAAISDRRRAARRMVSAWGEMTLGYDTNLTGVPNDFTSAIQQSFNIPGVSPTGNSIKRRAPYVGAAVGVDALFPITDNWNGYVGGDIRGRGYRQEGEFNSGAADVRASAIWSQAQNNRNQVRLNAVFNAFAQDGDAPGDPQPKNDRRTAIAGADWRISLTPSHQLTLSASGAQTRFPANKIEDFNSTIASVALLTTFDGKAAPILQLTAYGTRDKAVNKLADGVSDKSKKIAGLRAYGQINQTEKLSLFSAIGYATRTDDSGFARATTVEFGRDKLADVTIGVNWRFQDRCSMRAQVQSSKNSSNIAIYDYQRHEVSSTIRCEFM